MSADPNQVLIRIGLRIVRRRKELALSQDGLAERVGMARANITQFEHGNRNLTIRTLCRLADALELTLDELVTGRPPPTGEAHE